MANKKNRQNPSSIESPVKESEKMGSVIIVQLGRLGDILNIMPVALKMHLDGWEVHWLVCKGNGSDFTAAFAGQPWINVHFWENGPFDVASAVDYATNLGLDKVIVTQVNLNPTPCDPPLENFCAEMWHRAGMLDRYHDLPLLFERDDVRDGEMLAILDGVDKPILLYNLVGYSSPYPHVTAFSNFLMNTARRLGLHAIDLSAMRCDGLRDLLCLYERAACLLTTDTATLHLARAVPNLPVIALSRDVPWHKTEPMRNWALQLTYPESITQDGQKQVTNVLQMAADFGTAPMGHLIRPMEKMFARRLIHVAHCFDAADQDTARRNGFARSTWDIVAREPRSNWHTIQHRLKEDDRSSLAMGDTRAVPYVRDVIDLAAKEARANDVIVLTNADSCLILESPLRVLNEFLRGVPCCCSARVDFQRLGVPLRAQNLKNRIPYCGTDLFAFTREWWEQRRDEFPDMLIACEGWDWVLRMMILQDNPEGTMNPPVVYHEMHYPFWVQNRTSNPGQIHNRKIGREWAMAHGYDAWLHDEASAFLFRDKPLKLQPA
jgi:hypothetical protein